MVAFVWRCIKNALILAAFGESKSPEDWIGFSVFAIYFLLSGRECIVTGVGNPFPTYIRNLIALLILVFSAAFLIDLVKWLVLLIRKHFKKNS